jgi:hypothetical protein
MMDQKRKTLPTMKAPMKLTSLIVLASVVALGLTLPAQSAVLLDDTWADGTRTEQKLPTKSAWFVSKSSLLTATANSMTLAISTTSVMAVTYFTTNDASPVQLKVGDTLTARFTLTMDKVAPANKSQGFKLALVNSADSPLTAKRVTADKFSTSSQGYGVPGYALFQNIGATFERSAPLDIRKHTTLDSGLLSKSDDWTSLATGPGAVSSFPGFADGTPYVLQFMLQRTGTNSMVVGTIWSNTVNGATLALSATDGVATNFSFDGIAIRSSGASSSVAKIIFSEIKVELTPSSTPPSASKHP